MWLLPCTFRLHILILYPSDLYLFSIEVRLIVICTNDSKSHNYKSGTALLESSWEHGTQFIMLVLFLFYTLSYLHRTNTVGWWKREHTESIQHLQEWLFFWKRKTKVTAQISSANMTPRFRLIESTLDLWDSKFSCCQSQVFCLFSFWPAFLSWCIVMESPEVEQGLALVQQWHLHQVLIPSLSGAEATVWARLASASQSRIQLSLHGCNADPIAPAPNTRLILGHCTVWRGDSAGSNGLCRLPTHTCGFAIQ